jgi:DnaJ-like protein
MSDFEKIGEEKIRQALADGVFENLPGAGKPLRLDDDSMVAPDLRMAYKLLKDAHCLPPELELHKEILRLKDLLRGIEDETKRTHKIREINLLITKLNLLCKRPLSIEARQMVISRLSKQNDSSTSTDLGTGTSDAKS